MPDIGADALQGKKEYIKGNHTFTVTTQTKVIANGLMVSVIRAGQPKAEKTMKSTGDTGWSVSEGDKVRVFDAEVYLE